MAAVEQWLQSLGLQKYAPQFAAAHVDTLKQVAALDETQLKEMGVTVPGHVRRVLLSLDEVTKTLAATHLDVRVPPQLRVRNG